MIPRLSKDIRNELSEVKGFSERNIKRMLQFYREYPNLPNPDGNFGPQLAAQIPAKGSELSIVLQAAAQLENLSDQPIPAQLALGIPWFHHVILIEKIKELKVRYWYMDQTIENGWSRNTLSSMIKTDAYPTIPSPYYDIAV